MACSFSAVTSTGPTSMTLFPRGVGNPLVRERLQAEHNADNSHNHDRLHTVLIPRCRPSRKWPLPPMCRPTDQPKRPPRERHLHSVHHPMNTLDLPSECAGALPDLCSIDDPGKADLLSDTCPTYVPCRSLHGDNVGHVSPLYPIVSGTILAEGVSGEGDIR
jgi:hypothetical protein